MKRFVEKLPPQDVESIQNSLQKLEERWTEIKNTEKILQEKNLKTPEEGEEQEQFRQEILDLAKDSWNLKYDVKKLSGDALKRCDEIKEAEEQKLRRYTWLSYALYAVGWSLALWGIYMEKMLG